jgi:hypothetical protein
MAPRPLPALAILLLAACSVSGTDAARAGSDGATPRVAEQVEAVAQRFGGYTREQAGREGYQLDRFCLDATSFGLPASRGAMGFHATNESLLKGPIDAMRPQAFMFDADGRVLGVEYEILADAAKSPPQLFGRTFAKLPKHPGVEHEHYALHLWFVENPAGRFDDFNPRVSCPAGSKPAGPGQTLPPSEHGEGH